MAKYLPLPKSLKEADKNFLKDVLELTESKFKGDLFGEVNRPLSEPSTTFDGKYHWATNKDLLVYVTDLTGTGDVRSANAKLYQTLSQIPEYEAPTMTGAEPYAVESNTLTPGKLEELQEAKELEEQRRQRIEKSAADVRTAIERKKEIYAEQIKVALAAKEKLEKEKRYTKAEEEPRPALSKDQQTKKQEFLDEIQKDPDTAANIISREIQSRVVDIDPAAADIAATEMVNAYATPVDIAIAEEAKKNSAISAMAEQVLIQEKAKREVADIVVKMAFGEEFRKDFLPDVNVKVSQTPEPDYQPASLAFIPTRFAENVRAQKAALDNPNTTKPEWMKSWADRQLEMAKGGIQGQGSFNEGVVQGYLITYTYAPGTETHWSTSEGPSKLDVATGAYEPFNLIGSIPRGFGFGAATGTAAGLAASTTATATSVAATGGIMASEAFLGGAGAAAAAGAAAGSVVPGPGTIIGAIAGFFGGLVGGKLLDKVNLRKVKELSLAIVGAPIALVGFLVGSPALIMGGLGFFGLGLLNASGVTPASAGSGAVKVFSALGSATLGAIGPPIIFTLIGIPVIVTLILFIINSGAYIVPPGGFGLSGAIPISGTPIDLDCNNVKESSGSMVNSAELIYCALTKSGMNPLLASMVSQLQKLSSVLNGEAIDALAASAPVGNHLQCIGYVSAVAGQAYDQNWGAVSDACSYVNKAPGGYRYVSGTQGMGPGDVFVIGSRTCGLCGSNNAPAGSCGHIGVVVSVDGVGVSCADANADGRGSVRVNKGCFTLDDITGYISKR
jgi:hypothetical protein